MVEHVLRHSPEEACGLLGGPPERVERVYLIENTRHSPYAYSMDTRQQVEAMLDMEAAGWDVCGIFHSHPAGPPVPSQTDVEQAYYPDTVYVILSPALSGGWGMRGFQIEAGSVKEVALEIVP